MLIECSFAYRLFFEFLARRIERGSPAALRNGPAIQLHTRAAGYTRGHTRITDRTARGRGKFRMRLRLSFCENSHRYLPASVRGTFRAARRPINRLKSFPFSANRAAAGAERYLSRDQFDPPNTMALRSSDTYEPISRICFWRDSFILFSVSGNYFCAGSVSLVSGSFWGWELWRSERISWRGLLKNVVQEVFARLVN